MSGFKEIIRRTLSGLSKRNQSPLEKFNEKNNSNEREYYSADRRQKFVAHKSDEVPHHRGIVLLASENGWQWSPIMTVESQIGEKDNKTHYRVTINALDFEPDKEHLLTELDIASDGQYIKSGMYEVIHDITSVLPIEVTKSMLREKGVYTKTDLPRLINLNETAKRFLIQFNNLEFRQPDLVPLETFDDEQPLLATGD